MQRRISDGSPEPLGLHLGNDGANIAVVAAHASAIELCLFAPDGITEFERIVLPARTGDVFHGHIAGMVEGQLYGLRAHGPDDPARGHRYNPAKLLLDPYALTLDRPFVLHPAMFSDDPADSGPFMPKAVMLCPVPAVPARPCVPWAKTVIYELHVRGLTMQHPDIPQAQRGTFAGIAHPAMIAHFRALGVTTLELMPCAAGLDERHLTALNLTNYWGYNPIALMAPDPRLAPGGWAEIRAAVRALQAAGLEVIIDVVLNHTGEGDACGPTVSLRGLDSAGYYRHTQDGSRLIDDAGCGNVLALDRPHVLRLAMDALRAWALYGGVDGFRFDLATTLGRRMEGFDPAAPLLSAITQDPVLRALKLIAEPWDIGPGGYRIGAFPAAWGEWNDQFRDTMRKFWRGDAGLLGEVATRLSGSSDLFAPHRPARSINFIVAHDGFTLTDLVSYAHKHNAANGEANRDGTNDNSSWNNGIEGETTDPAILAARGRDQRNLLASLLLARGTPMLTMGAELGHTQHGNNNAYAQDNAGAWLDWTKADTGLQAFTSRLMALRRAHPALHQERFLTGEPVDASTIPDIVWRNADGASLHGELWHHTAQHTLIAALYAPATTDHAADRVLLVFNAAHAPVDVALPPPRAGYVWRVALDTADDVADTAPVGERIYAAARTVLLLCEVEDHTARKPGPADDALVDQLAQAAGIAPDWSDIAGRRTQVSIATKRALLESLGLACQSAAQTRDSLAQLADEADRRAVPVALTRHTGEEIMLRIPVNDGRLPMGLRLRHEDGHIASFRLRNGDLEHISWTGLDGRRNAGVVARLPAQAAGRYALTLDRPDAPLCHLTIAPQRGYLPADLRGFGISAQLYTVRRAGDQGIGDFTSLAQLGAHAAKAGATTLGLNPMHMMFPHERERASPYHPSDRRFLDPIYLDIAALEGVPALDPARLVRVQGLRDVDYAGVWALKRPALEAHFAAFDDLCRQQPDAAIVRDFAAFVQAGGAPLHRFALFQTLSDLHGRNTRDWPAELARCEESALEAFAQAHAPRVRYHAFLQFLCDRQLAAAAQHARDAGLNSGFYRDLAVGAAPDGAEIWANSREMMAGVSVGAPPDPFAEGGQNWGLPAPDPFAWRRSGCAAFAGLLAANMRHAGMLRIDHVMALSRLFVIPAGAHSSEGAYLAYPFADLLSQLTLESVRARCVVVGEDLGTVPEGFRARMDSAGVLSYRVLWFEREGAGFAPPAAYPCQSVACVSTHDLPTLAGWWEGADIEEKAGLGLLPLNDAAQMRTQREADRSEILNALHAQGLLYPALLATMPDKAAPLDPALARAIHDFVGQTASMLAMVQLDDLAGEGRGVNLPGTDRERPNWRRRLAPSLDALFGADAQAMLAGIRQARPPQTGEEAAS